jgi:hypothetical protein
MNNADEIASKPAKTPARKDVSRSRTTQRPDAAVVDRVWRTGEHELNDIESISDDGDVPRSRTEAERRVRTLAALSRTMNQIVKLRDQGLRRPGGKAKQSDDVPRELDEFRRELSRRLE